MKPWIAQIALLGGLLLAGCSSNDVAMYENKTTTTTEVRDAGYNKQIVTAREDTVIEVDD